MITMSRGKETFHIETLVLLFNYIFLSPSESRNFRVQFLIKADYTELEQFWLSADVIPS